jgi:FAD/FMN-containing dehydrogenase
MPSQTDLRPSPRSHVIRPMLDRLITALRCSATVTVEPGRVETDFGAWCRARPMVIACASTTEAVAHVVRTCRAEGAPLVVRGAGHSLYGQTLNEGGVVLLNRGSPEVRVSADGAVEVSTRTTWSDLERTLRRHGRTAPVLTDYLGLTVGGTLAVGGYGARSVSAGAQTEQVLRLQLVLPNGDVTWVEPTEELFGFALASLGAVGVIDRVVMRTLPRRAMSRISVERVPRWGDLAADLLELERSSPDGFWAAQMLWEPNAEVLTHTLEDADREADFRLRERSVWSTVVQDHASWSHQRREILLSLFGRRAKLWTDYVFEAGAVPAALSLMDQMRVEKCWEGLPTILYLLPIRREFRRAPPLLAAHAGTTATTLCFGVGVYMFPDPKQVPEASLALTRWSEVCRALGGRPYRYGFTPLSDCARRDIYGRVGDRLRLLRRQLDPLNLFHTSVHSAF